MINKIQIEFLKTCAIPEERIGILCAIENVVQKGTRVTLTIEDDQSIEFERDQNGHPVSHIFENKEELDEAIQKGWIRIDY